MVNHSNTILASHYIYLIAPPILLVVGVFGNLVSFCILLQRGMRKYSTYSYLLVLSISDTLVLLLGLSRTWLKTFFLYDYILSSEMVCRFFMFFSFVSSDYSVWLIVVVTCERYIAVCHPLRASSLCSQQRAARIMVFLLIIFFAVNLHFTWSTTIRSVSIPGTNYTFYTCYGQERWVTLVHVIWPWIDLILYSLLPFLIITVLNMCIVRQLIQARRQRRDLQSFRSNDESCELRRRPDVQSRHDQGVRLTVMLLTVSFAFLFTTLPIAITNMLGYLAKSSSVSESLNLAQTIAKMFMYINHSMNFFLYCATGNKFRQEFIRLIRFRKGLGRPGRASYTLQTSMMGTPKLRNGVNDEERVELDDLRAKRPACDLQSQL